jgi:broad specificity phosphatase PhoE
MTAGGAEAITALFLVRHGQSEWNAQGLWQGQADPPLSAAGREQAVLAAETLERFDGPFFASPLLRAHQTAEIVSRELSDGVVKLETDMREIDVGDFSGLTNHEIEQRMPDAWAALRAGELEAFPNGESRKHFLERLLEALDAIASRHPGEQIFVATHGGAIGAIERHLDAHPGTGVRNLEGRWFEVGGSGLRVLGERVQLAPDQES